MQEFKRKYMAQDNNLNNFKQRNNDIMEVVHSLENYNILFKGVTETIKNETKEQKGGFPRTLVGTLGLILLGNLLSGKGIY